jgi:GntR family transcriptional regulator, transcriptional repressor for pyruvate dehydrogenase complex
MLKITAVPPRNTLVSSVVAQLAQQIRSGVVAPGSKLPTETELCALFQVSRTVVREAVAQLKAEELVETVHGVGLYVTRSPPGQGVLRLRASAGNALDTAREMLDFRAGLESQAARLAAERRSASDLDAMKRALAGVDRAERSGASGTAQDLDFHMAIAQASRNAFIVQVQDFLMASLQAAISHSREIGDTAIRTAHFEIARREHAAVLAAIAARQPDLAAQAMQQHLTEGHARLLAAAAKDNYGDAPAPATSGEQ